MHLLWLPRKEEGEKIRACGDNEACVQTLFSMNYFDFHCRKQYYGETRYTVPCISKKVARRRALLNLRTKHTERLRKTCGMTRGMPSGSSRNQRCKPVPNGAIWKILRASADGG